MAENEKMELGVDENGAPILLAVRAPGQVAAQPNPSGIVQFRGARSGNPNSDPATGRFAGNSGNGNQPAEEEVIQQTRTIPQGITEEEWDRRQDIVRDAARELDDMDIGDAKEFLKGRVKSISKVDIALFLRDVRAQRIDDLTDLLDANLRRKIEGMRRARRHVRLQAPKGWLDRTMGGLKDEEVMRVVSRLENRGYKREDLIENVVGKIKDEQRRESLELTLGKSKKTKTELSDWINHRPDALNVVELDDEDDPVHTNGHDKTTAIELAEVMKNLPQPIINVHVDATRSMNKRVVRDENDRIIGIEEADDVEG